MSSSWGARGRSAGTDVTLVAWGAMVDVCERAARPWRARRRSRCSTCGRSSRSTRKGCSPPSGGRAAASSCRRRRARADSRRRSALLAERAILDLHGPVLRVTGFDVPYPYWQLEDWYMPSVERVVDAARRVLAFDDGSGGWAVPTLRGDPATCAGQRARASGSSASWCRGRRVMNAQASRS